LRRRRIENRHRIVNRRAAAALRFSSVANQPEVIMSRHEYTRAAFLALLVGCAAGAALADDTTPPAAPPAPRSLPQACAADYQTLCAGVQPGGGRIRACFRANADKISPACKQALKDARAARAAPPPST
jgi:hypothetical protein